MTVSRTSRLLEAVCESFRGFQLLFAIGVVALLLMLIWFPFVPSGSATRVVVVMNVFASSGFVLGSGVIVWKCRQRSKRRKEAIRGE